MTTVETTVANVDAMQYAEQAGDFATPDAGFWRMYFKSGGLFYIEDDGAVTGPINLDASIILDPTSDTRNIIEPAADFIPLIVRGSAAAQTKQIFVAQEGSGNTEVFSLAGAGRAIFQNFTDSTTGFQIFDKAGSIIFNVDTTNEFVGIGLANPSATLEVAGTVRMQPVSNNVGLEVVGYDTAPTANIANFTEGTTGSFDVVQIKKAGAVQFQNQTDSTEAFVVWDAASAGEPLLQLDTANMRLGINDVPEYPFHVGAGNAVFNSGNAAGNTTINGVPVSAHYDMGLVGDGVLMFKETSTPTADTNYGKLYTKNDNELYFQDGAGTEHLVHGDAFSNIWFHGAATASTIAAVNAFAVIDTFTVVGSQDDLGNAVGNISTNTITIAAGAGGDYEIIHGASISAAGGADKEMVVQPGITLNTVKDITNVTDDTVTPIVITSVAHGFENGDMVEIVDVLVNTAANGSFMVANKANDTFEIVVLDGSATTGNGDYDEGTPTGDITIWYPGTLTTHREVRNATLGVVSHAAPVSLFGGDVVKLYVANLDDANNLTVYQVNLTVKRFAAE